MKTKSLLIALLCAIAVPFGPAVAKTDNPNANVHGQATDGVAQPVVNAQNQPETVNRVTSAKIAAQQRKIALKQDRCEAKMDKLAARVPQLSQNITTIKRVLDGKYTKVTDIYKSGTLSADNYGELDKIVQAKKAIAESTIAAIDVNPIAIDCHNIELGMKLDVFRSSVVEAKTALKDYHTALVALVSALNNAADKVDTTANLNKNGAHMETAE